MERHADEGVVVLGVNGEEDREKEAEFARAKELNYPVLVGAKEILESYGVSAFPTHMFVDREGVVRDRQLGFDEKRLLERLESLLEEKPKGATGGD